jgi:hypothetical protein
MSRAAAAAAEEAEDEEDEEEEDEEEEEEEEMMMMMIFCEYQHLDKITTESVCGFCERGDKWRNFKCV